jgi:hypothetical protein
VSTHARGDVEITLIENDYDPDTTDTTYETTFVYLVRRAGIQEVHTDHHLGVLFPQETWFRILRETGFEVRERLAAPGQDYPILLCRR